MTIFVSTRLRSYDISLSTIEKIADALLKKLELSHLELSIVFVGSQRMKNLNYSYRNKNKITDVLSFPKDKKSPAPILGDVVICPHQALIQAEEIGHSLGREVIFLMIHGILHLCGYDHMNKTDEKKMLTKQKELLSYLSSRSLIKHRCVTYKTGQ